MVTSASSKPKRFVLEVPFVEKTIAARLGARWEASRSAWVYDGDFLPEGLKVYLPSPYTWMDYQMKAGRGNVEPVLDTGEITLRDDQQENVDTLLAAFAQGAPEVLVASKTGTGKTFVALALARALPLSGKILVVCPPSAAPAWRRSIDAMGPAGKRYVIIGYASLKKLIKPPAANPKDAKRAKTKAGERNRKRRINREHAASGRSYVPWDVIIFDETHYLGNPDAERTMAAETLVSTSLNARVIKVSATVASNPAKLICMARGLAWRTGSQMPSSRVTATQWVAWCQSKGISVSKSKWGDSLVWERNESELDLINRMLFSGLTPWAVRADPGWDQVVRYQVPLELTRAEREAYAVAWDEFQSVVAGLKKAERSAVSPHAKRDARAKGLAAFIRYRQKVGVLKAPYIAQYVKDLLEGDVQVAISVEFMTTLDALLNELKGIDVAIITGSNPQERESERQAFQRGDKKVCIFTISEAISLHQGERGGNDVPRVQVCAEPSAISIQAIQKEGRTNRDGSTAPVVYPSAVDTIDYKVIKTQMENFSNVSRMMGEDDETMTLISSLSAIQPGEDL